MKDVFSRAVGCCVPSCVVFKSLIVSSVRSTECLLPQFLRARETHACTHADPKAAAGADDVLHEKAKKVGTVWLVCCISSQQEVTCKRADALLCGERCRRVYSKKYLLTLVNVT